MKIEPLTLAPLAPRKANQESGAEWPHTEKRRWRGWALRPQSTPASNSPSTSPGAQVLNTSSNLHRSGHLGHNECARHGALCWRTKRHKPFQHPPLQMLWSRLWYVHYRHAHHQRLRLANECYFVTGITSSSLYIYKNKNSFYSHIYSYKAPQDSEIKLLKSTLDQPELFFLFKICLEHELKINKGKRQYPIKNVKQMFTLTSNQRYVN